MLFKRQWKHIDKVLVAAAVLIVAISICIIGSATHINKGAINYDFVAKQGGAFIVNLLLVLFICNYDYTKLRRIAKPLYVINLLMELSDGFKSGRLHCSRPSFPSSL